AVRGRPRPAAGGRGRHGRRAPGLRGVRGPGARGRAGPAALPRGGSRQQPPRRGGPDRDRHRRRGPRRGLPPARAPRGHPRRAPPGEPRGATARDPRRARRHAPLRRLGSEEERDPPASRARGRDRAAARGACRVAGGVHGDPRRLLRPGSGARRRPVARVQPLYTAAEVRRLDRRAIDELGIPAATLMENAGRGAAEEIRTLLEDLKAGRNARVAVVCGKGGNGGDGFVAARWLKKWGARPEVLLAFPEGEIGGDAAEMLRALKRTGVRPWRVEDEGAAAEALASAHVVVDALLGTGARGAPEGLVARLIKLINASDRPVVALDVPSGAPADGEAPAGPAVHATLTLTFAGWKRGLVTGVGPELAGEVVAELAARRDAVALGPGIGLDEETRAAARALVQELPKPMAVDADALSALAGHLDLLRGAPAARCLTPHPGELARMLGVTVDEVQRDRIE